MQLFCRPKAVVVQADGAPAPPGFGSLAVRGRIAGSAFLGEYALYDVDLPGGTRWRVYSDEGAAACEPRFFG